MSTEHNKSCVFAVFFLINVKLVNTSRENIDYFDIHGKISQYLGSRTTTEIPLACGFEVSTSQIVDTRHTVNPARWSTVSSASALISQRTHSDLEQLFRPERVHHREHVLFIINISHGER
jgi:hypothetical protein